MLDTLFKGIFDSSTTSVISVSNFLLCVGLSLVLGIIMALSYTYKTRYTKSFLLTLAILPAVVCVVIMMVNGNVGTGVAVAGIFFFNLARFSETNKFSINHNCHSFTQSFRFIHRMCCHYNTCFFSFG